MDSNIADERDFDGNLLLPEPHFDEEATLLSAQPVVPLDIVRSERHHRKLISFGIAIISALALGVLAAKLIYRSTGEEQSPAVVSDVAHENPESTGVADPAPSLNAVTAKAKGGGTEVLQNTAKIDTQTPVKQEPVKNEVSRRNAAPPRAEKADLPGKRLEDEPERSRERRKDGRRRQNKSTDGLLRIREIFEGPAKP